MQAFGIEIRKSNSLGIHYQDVDSILAHAGILGGRAVSQNIQGKTSAHSLQGMMKVENWFDVCKIDSCREVAQIHIPREHYAIIKPLTAFIGAI